MSEASDTEDRARGIVADVLQRTCTSICHDAATSIRCIECRREEALKHGSLKCFTGLQGKGFGKYSLDVCHYPATWQGNVSLHTGNIG